MKKRMVFLLTVLMFVISITGFAKSKELVIAVNANFISLDPHNLSDTLSGTASATMYEGLLKYENDMTLKPLLAESYNISKDGLTYTFKIRKGIKFSDGTALDAKAVKYNFDRVMDKKKNLRRRRNFLAVQKVEAIGADTVKIILKTPYSPMGRQYRSWYCCICCYLK